MARTVHVVAHTHWDREWYEPFPVFRMRLVELLDGLLPVLDHDDAFAHFQLDGQMAAVDDFLEIRPHEQDRLTRLNRAGRLSMGPWYTLPDEFLVSGETHVRNLRLGLARAEELGGAMAVGYLPDMFGHVAQMPQILAGFGFDDAVVWRGVPSAINAPSFDWVAPDGTMVRAEYLADGYGNGARTSAAPGALVRDLDAFVAAHGRRAGDPLLWMYGTDHQIPDPEVVDAVAAEASDDACGSDPDYRVRVTSLPHHLAAARAAEQSAGSVRPRWVGELRSGARANLLMGVASCRVDVKQAAARAERWLERVAEPLAACWMPPADWPGAFFQVAWREMVRNAAHDSICGCSADEVNDAVLHRYAEATRVAEELAKRAVIRALAASGEGTIVTNPTARTRTGVVRAVVPGDIAPADTQQLGVRPARARVARLGRRAAVAVAIRAAVDDPRVSRVELIEDGDEPLLLLHADRQTKAIDLDQLRSDLRRLASADPDGLLTIDLVRPGATQEVLLRTAPVPGFGWRGLAPADLGDHAVRANGLGLTNGLVTVAVDPDDGTFAINATTGFGRLVDEGDEGDTYNWSPPTHGLPVERPDRVEVQVVEAGPVRGRVKIRRYYLWPVQVIDGYRVDEVEVEVETTVEVRAGEDLVRVEVVFTNPSKDHRLRVHLPLPQRAGTSVAECAFGTVERGLVAEGGANEIGLPTFPSRRFVQAGGLTVAHDGLCEYELVDLDADGTTAGALALTLLRSVGTISRGPMAMRALPAGPPTPTPAAQLVGHLHRTAFVLHVGDRDPYAVADEAFTPLLVGALPHRGFGDAAASGQALAVDGVEVTALTRRTDGRLELRGVNPTDEPTMLTAPGRSGQLTDLRGEPTGETFDGELLVAPHRIVTIALDEPDA